MRVAFAAAALSMMAASACPGRAVLRLEPAGVYDQSVPLVSPVRPQRLMVLPAPGARNGAPLVAEFERLLLSAQVELVSPGLVPQAAPGAPDPLTHLERAMATARQANVDALFEILEFGWLGSYRPFEQLSDTFREIRPGTPVESGRLVRVSETRFVLKGRLIDARDGRILVLIDLSQGTSRVFEPAKDIELSSSRQGKAREITTDTLPRREVAKQQVMHTAAMKLLSATTTPAAPPVATATAASPEPPQPR